ncbi:TIGR00282 family metallophosphoesterase [Roseibium salinum]|uniref:TIGR00282 family metallophosphoesterase n=1 Tax=Roseibium salinum TaxID=1604349 RepID=A0ABT3R8A4_9HYPH|nr:TIGR00282 family metallophosphoesterase [Roseibium sp. DSM 29163]MCX2725387.1 TIGR00282 family metallophosphoesterase [Roseibium sp. DSM 29163]
MRILFLGDLVGRVGRTAVIEKLPELVEHNQLDFVIVNGENSASGFGITEAILQDVLDAGADVVTTGNHVWDQRETLVYIERQDRLLRPVNYPPGTPGRGAHLYTARNGAQVMVANVMGRIFMDALDDPFAAVGRVVDECPLGQVADAIVIDMHAEATSEKQAMAHFLDGRVSLVVGTHTHVPTADHQILENGTAYISDAGMCGAYDSVLGMDKDEPVNRFQRKIPRSRFTPATGRATISGVAIETDDSTGLAERIAPVRIGGRLEPALPAFWPSAG